MAELAGLTKEELEHWDEEDAQQKIMTILDAPWFEDDHGFCTSCQKSMAWE